MKCLEKKAEHRYQTARELKVDLDRVLTRQGTLPVLVSATSEVKSGEPRKKISWKLIRAALVLCLAITGGFYWRQHHPPTVAKSTTRQSIAVLGFKNDTGNKQDDWISSILTTQLPSELAAGEKVRIVSEEDVNRAKQDLSLTEANTLASDTLTRIKKRLNADRVVLGSFSNVDNLIHLTLYVQDTNSGETTSFPANGNVKQIEQLITSAGFELRKNLGLEIDTAQLELIQASMPSNPQAARNYAEGVAKLRMSDALGARDLLQQASSADPNYAMAHSALSTAWDQLGYDAKKQEEAKRAFDLSGNLLREQKLLVEARYREAASEWDKAADIYRTLQTIAPDELDYGLKLASMQIRGDHAQDGLATIQRLRMLPSPQRDDPRIDMAEAEAGQALSDPAVVKAAAASAIQKGQQSGARLLVAQAEWRRCSALRFLGELDAARAAGEHALQIYKDTADVLGQARSVTCLANVLDSKGDGTGALALHEQALGFANSIGARRDSAGANINIANILSDRGDLNGAVQRYQNVLSIAREIDDKGQMALAENNVGLIYFSQGKYEAAAQTFETARRIAKGAGDLKGLIQARMNLSSIRFQQGKFAEAKEGIHEAIAAAKQLNNQANQADASQTLGDISLAQDQLADAEQSYSAALVIQTKLGDKEGMASSRQSLAGLELERAQPAKAEALANQAVDEFAAEKGADAESSARILKARTLLQQGKIKEARAEIDQAQTLKPSDRSVKIDLLIAEAQVLTYERKFPEASTKFIDVIGQANRAGLKVYELRARLAAGEGDLLAGNKNKGTGALRSVQKDAAKMDFKLIVRKTTELIAKN